MLSHDGSGKGAAIITAVAHRLRENKAGEVSMKMDNDLNLSDEAAAYH